MITLSPGKVNRKNNKKGEAMTISSSYPLIANYASFEEVTKRCLPGFSASKNSLSLETNFSTSGNSPLNSMLLSPQIQPSVFWQDDAAILNPFYHGMFLPILGPSNLPSLLNGDMRNSATSANRFGNIFLTPFFPMNAESSILIFRRRQ
jgi:hypothetical protein